MAEDVTDTDGAFFLPLPERKYRIVEVVSEAWRVSPKKHRLDEKQTLGLTELLFEAERIVSAPLRGRILDSSTGEPVPEFLVQARGPRDPIQRSSSTGNPEKGEPRNTMVIHFPPLRTEDILTGAEGQFESSGGFEAGELDLVLVDNPSLLEEGWMPPDEENSVVHVHDFQEATPPSDAEIRVLIGPTYRLDMTLPTGTQVEDFYASFPPPQFSGGSRAMHRLIAGNPSSSMARRYGGALSADTLYHQAPLRVGQQIWTRFRNPVFDWRVPPGETNESELHIRSHDGYWSGTAIVRSLVGIYPEVVSVTLTGQGAIEGSVLDDGGKPVPTAWIQLYSSSALSEAVREVGADAKGRFSFNWLPAGEYEVSVQTDLYMEWNLSASIEAGSTEQLEARLSARVPLGMVSGSLRSRTGQHRSKGAIVWLRSLNDPDFYLFRTARYRKHKGEYEAAFSFDAVPFGDYELSIKPIDNMRWESRRMIVSPSTEGVEFVCEDDTPTFDLEFRAIDSQTGDPIKESWNIVWQGDPLENVRMDANWETGLYGAVPEGVPLHWVLSAKGYRLARGDESEHFAEAGHRVIEARMVRGWGQIFIVTTDDQDPIEGATLVVDGVAVGTSDPQGMVSMDLDAKPSLLEFRYGDWHVSWGRMDPGEEDFGWGPETPVYLSPDD